MYTTVATGGLDEKLKYNFKVHILLCLKGVFFDRQYILQLIYNLNGYRCHKVVRFGTYWSHIHIKFTDEQKAKEAVNYFNNLNSDFMSSLLYDLLKAYYIFEMSANYSPPYTLAIVDVVGTTPQSMDFLTENLVNSILQDFGKPYMLPYTAALPETHVQVLFSSMTEALATCMAFGQWYRMNRKTDQFFYRARISPGEKEELLVTNSGGVPEEAFKLDYFLKARREMRRITGSGKSTFQRNLRSYPSHKEAYQKDHKQNYFTDKRRHRNTSQMSVGTPVMCIPVIAPLNRTRALDHSINKKFSDSVHRFQNKCVEVTKRVDIVDTTADEMNFYSSGQINESTEINNSGGSSQNAYLQVSAAKDDPLTNCIDISNSFPHASANSFPHASANSFPQASANSFPQASANSFPQASANSFPQAFAQTFSHPLKDIQNFYRKNALLFERRKKFVETRTDS